MVFLTPAEFTCCEIMLRSNGGRSLPGHLAGHHRHAVPEATALTAPDIDADAKSPAEPPAVSVGPRLTGFLFTNGAGNPVRRRVLQRRLRALC